MLQRHSALRPFFRRYLSVTTFAAATAMSLATPGAALAAAPCMGPGAPSTTETKCLTAVAIPGNPLRSFDISWVNPFLNQYYFADRSNAGIEVINTASNMFTVRLGGFVGIKLNTNGTVNNNISGPDGVTSHGNWVYGGDGDSTLKVFNVFALPTTQPPISQNGVPTIFYAQSIPTGGTTRVDEMALTPDGRLLLAPTTRKTRPSPRFSTLTGIPGRPATSASLRRSVWTPRLSPRTLGCRSSNRRGNL